MLAEVNERGYFTVLVVVVDLRHCFKFTLRELWKVSLIVKALESLWFLCDVLCSFSYEVFLAIVSVEMLCYNGVIDGICKK